MRRKVRHYLAALLVGFGGTWLIGEAQRVGSRVRPAQQLVLLGGVDVLGYCTSTLGAKATAALVAQNAGGWRCASVFGELFETRPIDMDDACRRQYRQDAFARAADRSSPQSWQCWRVVTEGERDQRAGTRSA